VFREANSPADAVASHGMSIDTGIKLLDSIPDFIYLLLLADASAATWYCR